MKYIKAQQVFPESLLVEIQKYIQGEYVYIPKAPDNHNEWGASTDTKTVLAKRNENIASDFRDGLSILHLADSYGLAVETIKKIVYVK